MVLESVATIVFTIGGVEVALRKRLDFFGMLILAFFTSVGGGTIRDLMLGCPIFWIQERMYIYVIFSFSIVFYFVKNKSKQYVHNDFFIALDALGLGLFSILGCYKAIYYGATFDIAIAMGAITGCFGGLLRDILVNEVPTILRQEFYATAGVAGAASFYLFFIVLGFSYVYASIIGVAFTFIVRIETYRHKYNVD